MTSYYRLFLCVLLITLASSMSLAQEETITPESVPAIELNASMFGAIEARHIGPATMSGRVSALDASADDPCLIYVASAGGGVWKSTNCGTTFDPVFDDHTQSTGAVTIDPNDPETVWVGTGEPWTRNSVSVGTGVYKTTNGGESWTHMGLPDSERIAKIIVDPSDSETVYVCALGHLWDGNEERGLYKTTDGGENWESILYVDENTGCTSLTMDPQEPDVLYSAMWEFRRQPAFFTSGGPGSGIYRSTDAGATWERLETGLPTGELGRMSLAVAPSRPSMVYAFIEATDGQTGMYRSMNMGSEWTRMSEGGSGAFSRPFYFAYIVVDPTDYNVVYKPAVSLFKSTDGGATFNTIGTSGPTGGGVHSDIHALWVDPNNAKHVYIGTDGGVYQTWDGGSYFLHHKNLPLSQFYHVSFDMETPYNVYGGLQDNGSWRGPSRKRGGVKTGDWENLFSGDGFYAFAHPENSDLVYVESQGGNVARFYRTTGETKAIKPEPQDGEPAYRWSWNTPIALSQHNPNRVYVGSQFLFKSDDRGDNWTRISEDLTTNDPEKQRQSESGGITIDNTTAENHTTIYTVSESPLDENVIWVGTDDGLLHVTRDGGQTWDNVISRVPELPANTWVTEVEASPHAAGTAHVVFDGHRTGDMTPYVYRTHDFGQTWEALAGSGIEGYALSVAQDLVNSNLLFVGTEFGLYISLDAGKQWVRFSGNLPKVGVREIQIHPREADVILATHGRGIVIIDDITPLRQLTTEILTQDTVLLPARPSIRQAQPFLQEFPGHAEFVGANPNEGAVVTYYLQKRHIFGDLKVDILDADGKLVSSVPGGKRKGINRVNWPMRRKPPKSPPGAGMSFGGLFGPMVGEGTYTIRLIKGRDTYEGALTLTAPDNTLHAPEDRALQAETVLTLYHMLDDIAYMGSVLTEAKTQATARTEDAGRRLRRALNEFSENADALLAELYAQSAGGFDMAPAEQLREKVSNLYGAINGYQGRPSVGELAQLTFYQEELARHQATFDQLINTERAALNERLTNDELSTIDFQSRSDFDNNTEGLRPVHPEVLQRLMWIW